MNNLEKYIRFILLSFLILTKTGFLFAQKEHQSLEDKAKKAFSESDYNLVLNLYDTSSELEPKMVYRKALCYFNLNKFDSAITCFQIHLKFKKHNVDALFFIARCYHHLENYDQASKIYRDYLKKSTRSAAYRTSAKLLLLQSANAESVIRSECPTLILPLSETLNSSGDDYSPIENQRFAGQYFYSSRKNKQLEMLSTFFSESKNNSLRLDARYNSTKEQQIVAFPDNGFQLLYLSNSRLLIDNYKDGFEQSLAVVLKGFEKITVLDAHLINDSLLIFSSDMPGGYGGSDLYIAHKDSKGIWSEIKNLGPTVNSVFDEKTPYLADKSTQLFFSSNRAESIGGFDIFMFDLSKNESPIVFSYPINTSGDELYFKPNYKSDKSWLSSVRKNGFGGLDNYNLILRDNFLIVNDTINLYNIIFKAVEKKEIIAEVPLEQKDSIQISSINYDSLGKFEIVSYKILDEISKNMLKYPDLELLVEGHSDDSESKNIALLQSLTQAEKVSLYLMKKGISGNRIYLRGLAGQYPAAKNKKFDSTPDLTARMINKRIEFKIKSNNNKSLKILNKQIMISTVLKETAAENYLENVKGLSFRIDLASNDNDKSFEFIGNLNDASIEKMANSSKISFCIGLSKKFDAISIMHETIKESGFNNASIRAYWDGFPMDNNLIEDKIIEEPELKKYKEYLMESGK